MNHHTGIRLTAAAPVLAAAALVAALAPSAAWACSTPVYRVAMYDWTPAPCHVFYMHRGPVPEADAKVNRQIAEAAQGKTPANVTLHVVDLADQKKFEDLPEMVRKAWKADQKEGQPLYLVYSASAWPAKLFAGKLDAAEVAKLLDSPKRAKLAELLDAGNALVLLVLTGPDKAKNEKAEKAVAQIVADAAAGKILTGLEDVTPAQPAGSVPEGPQPAGGEKQKIGPQKPADPKLKVVSLVVSRTDPAEQWVVRSLTSVESDLGKYANEPMVFAVFGRGRVLPPFVGKGITPDLLTEVVAFVAGACSCTIKDQNPGEDLLVRWDWQATAQKLAASDPSLAWQGDGLGYQEVEPVGTAETAGRTAPADDVAAAAKPGPKPEAKAAVDPPKASGARPASAEKAAPAEAVPVEPAAAKPADGSQAAAAEADAADAFAARQTWRLAIGIGLAAVVILGASLALLRRH